MSENKLCLYHRVMKRENFEVAAKDIFGLLVKAQKDFPDKPRVLYVDIDGHRNAEGGFDSNMLELQKEFGLGFLLQFLCEVHFPLISVENPNEQNNNIPEGLQILNAENKRDESLDELYIENYRNTEFMSEDEVYVYLMKVSEFLRQYNDSTVFREKTEFEKFDADGLFGLWHMYLKDIINELFNSFIYGNLLSATAMTRTLIECYVYLSILKKEQNVRLLEDWYLCSFLMKARKSSDEIKEKILKMVKAYCKKKGRDYDEVYRNFYGKNENSWLSSVIPGKRNSEFGRRIIGTGKSGHLFCSSD